MHFLFLMYIELKVSIWLSILNLFIMEKEKHLLFLEGVLFFLFLVKLSYHLGSQNGRKQRNYDI